MNPSLERQLQLPARPTSAGEARRFVGQALRDAGVRGNPADTTLLLTSELVTNAVLHAAGGIVIDVALAPESVRVEVFDSSPEAPRPRRAAPDATSGRGLGLVEDLARAWGVIDLDAGKAVWFEVETAEATSPAS